LIISIAEIAEKNWGFEPIIEFARKTTISKCLVVQRKSKAKPTAEAAEIAELRREFQVASGAIKICWAEC
jgi:hypothetical protein